MYHALHRVRYYRMLRVVWLAVECPARDATRGVRVEGREECGGRGGWKGAETSGGQERRGSGLFVCWACQMGVRCQDTGGRESHRGSG